MKYFETNGLWFPARDPTNAVGGIFRFSQDGLQLTLLGSFRERWSPSADEYPIIHGVVGSNPYGSFVTIFGGMRKSITVNMPGVTSEVIRGERAILGVEHLEDESRVFEEVSCEFSYATEWYGRTGIQFERLEEGETGIAIRYSMPESVELPIGEGTLKIGLAADADNSMHRASIDEKVSITIVPNGRLDSSDFIGRFIRPIQDLLSFATDTPNAIDDIAFRGDPDERFKFEVKKEFNLIYDAVFKLEAKKDRLSTEDMVFTFADSQEAGLDIFQKWLEFMEKYSSFCTIYFATQYVPPKYLDEKFSRLMSAFTLLCTSLGEVSDRTKGLLSEMQQLLLAHFSGEERGLLGHAFPTGAEVEMPIRMLSLLEENSDLMSQVIEGEFKGFVRSVSDTMAYVARRASPGGRPVFEGKKMYYAIHRIRILIKIVILKELGFDHSRVVDLIERNNYFKHLKGI